MNNKKCYMCDLIGKVCSVCINNATRSRVNSNNSTLHDPINYSIESSYTDNSCSNYSDSSCDSSSDSSCD